MTAFADVVQWFQRSLNRRILAAIITVGSFTVIVKAAAMTKELVVAYRFGTGDVIDAFLMAFVLPALVVNVITGSFSAAFTPVYIAVREREGRPAAFALLQSAWAASAVLVLGVTVLLAAAVPALPLLAAGFTPEKLALTRTLFLLMLPVIVLNAFIALASAALNCEGKFAWAAVAPVGVPVLTLGAALISAPGWGGHALAVGTALGYGVQAGILAVALVGSGMPVLPRWGGRTPELRTALRQYFPMTAGALLMSGTWVIGQAMAATMPAGSVAALNYGNKIPAVVMEVGSLAIATAVLPHFSELVARRQWPALRHTLRTYVRLIGVVMVPATLLAIYLSPLIVRLLFERGAFTPADTRTVSTIQSLYLLQLPFVMIGMLFVRLASSLGRNQILLVGAAITLPLNVVLNAVLMPRLGVGGIALATSAVYVVSCGYLLIATRRAMGRIEEAAPGGGAT